MLYSRSLFDSRLFQDGCVFEVEVLGRCMCKCTGKPEKQTAFAQVRQHQPTRKTSTVVALECAFENALGMPVRFYTAVGSALDFYYGIDAFIEFNGQIVTIDLTMNDEKVCGRADVIVHKNDLPKLLGILASAMLSKFEPRNCHLR